MPSTWQELVDAVRAAQHDLTGGNEAQPLWYRGQPDASWKLTPSLFRLKDWAGGRRSYSKTSLATRNASD